MLLMMRFEYEQMSTSAVDEDYGRLKLVVHIAKW